LGNAIGKKAKAKFKTNVDFAFACDVDEKSIRRILNGEQNVSIMVMKRICSALEIKMSELLAEINQ
jgi:transcriptional regulator with XRE-family HTH domain